MKALNLFPLTVAKDVINIDNQSAQYEIENMQLQTNTESTYAWTGDTKGHEFLFGNSLFKNLGKKFQIQLLNIYSF